MNSQQIARFVDRLVNTKPLQSLHAKRKRHSFALESIRPDGPKYFRVTLPIDPVFAQEHTTSAQYTTLKLGDLDPRFFVIASPPGSNTWEFLIDQDSSVGRALSTAPLNTHVSVSEPEGRGFDSKLLIHRPLLAFATGSGIATILPLVKTLLDQGHPPELLSLFYGEDDPQTFAYTKTLHAWQDQGVSLAKTSQDHPKSWRFVQDAFLAQTPSLERAHVVMGGAPMMIRSVSTMLLERGLSAQRLLLNI